jgi:uncharacterized membrane protein
VSVLWVGLGALALAVVRVDRPGRSAYLIADGSLVLAAAAVALRIVAPPSMLGIGEGPLDPVVLVQVVVALGAVVAGLLLVAREGLGHAWGRAAGIAAGVTAVYLVSVGVVGLVATQVGGATTTQELRTQGQVALSIVWTVMGITGFVAGLRLRNDDLRHGGLALLALATAKVFLFDLGALDVAYRVISLIVLGLVLLASAWLWQRAQPRPPVSPAEGHHPA